MRLGFLWWLGHKKIWPHKKIPDCYRYLMAGKNDDLRLMAARLSAVAGGRGRRSPVYQWMFKHADTFQRLLNETQPSWKSVADALTALDVRDGAGNPPSAECARQAWQAVKKAKTRPVQKTPASVTVIRPVAASPLAPQPVPQKEEPTVEITDDPLAAIRREMFKRSGRKV